MGKRSGIQLCYPFTEKRFLEWDSTTIVQPKLNGERCRAVRRFYGDSWTLYSSELNEFFSVPHINQELFLQDIHPDILELDGELYVHGWDFPEIHSVVGRTKNLHPQYEHMQFHVFDTVNDLPQFARIPLIKKVRESDIVKHVPHHLVDPQDLNHLTKVFDKYINDGYEGIITRHLEAPYIRKRSTLIMKFKPSQTDSYRIIGFTQALTIHGEPKLMLGALVCESDGNEFKVSAGAGLSEDERREWWKNREDLSGRWVTVRYQHKQRGVPMFVMKIEIGEHEENIKDINPLL